VSHESETPSNANKLLSTLREVLQYDRRDLDFGIYRVLNHRREEIDQFLSRDLLPSIEETFAAADNGRTEIQGRLDDAETKAEEIGADPDASPVVQELRKLLSDSASSSDLADLTCSDLERFFRRYYERGDFLSLRRYKANTYAVPYEGEETLLHWANKDQFYIKSSQTLSMLGFDLADGRSVRLAVVDADENAGNSKPAPGEERRFVLADSPVIVEDDLLTIRFVFAKAEKGSRQSALDLKTVETLLKNPVLADWRIALDGGSGEDGPFARRVAEFTSRNSYDYFIHRDLGGFLSQELDHFITTEVVHVDDLAAGRDDLTTVVVSRARVVRTIGRKVIDFLHQVEEFQKRAWLRKKIVLDTSWLVTVDRIPEDLRQEVVSNQAQVDQWIRDFSVDEITEATLDGPAFSDPLDVKFLDRLPSLVVDTRLFPNSFTEAFLSSIDNLDAAISGTIIHGENFQAMNLVSESYAGSIAGAFIDPPYNTGSDGFLYKDQYQHSSWMTMMRERLDIARNLLSDDGAIYASIDDDEHPRLRLVFDEVFGASNFVANIVWQKKYSPANDAKWFSDDHDHIIVTARNKNSWRPTKLARTRENDAQYKNPDDDPRGPWMSDNYVSNKSRTERPNSWYAITNPHTGDDVWPSETAVWRYTKEQHEEHVREERVWWGTSGTNSVPRFKRFLSEVGPIVPRTVWTHKEAGHNQDGVRDLKALFGRNVFSSPKPVRLMERVLATMPGNTAMDFFAGSGTFGQAILAEGDSGSVPPRKFLLVEAGPHFETVLRPRIVRCLHSKTWSDGKPQDRNGPSALVRCFRVEAYEDVLDGTELRRSDAQQALLENSSQFRTDYLLRYMLSVEENAPTLGAAAFDEPLAIDAIATVDGAKQAASVDLATTFNLAAGLRVSYIEYEPGLCVVKARDKANRRVLVIWRSLSEFPNEKLDDWFRGFDRSIDGVPPERVYVNRDATIGMVRLDEEEWSVHLLEEEFERAMNSTAIASESGWG
jgi:adenine-specific DNA-methyltransferase